MRYKSGLLILLVISLCFSLFMRVEAQTLHTVEPIEQLSEDYIKASLLVVSPDRDVYSIVGHSLLRLHCPSKGMDYCFSFESSTATQNLFRFLYGSAQGQYRATATSSMLSAYLHCGRGVIEYPLNLKPEEKLTLWMVADDHLANGKTWQYGYLHSQCTSRLINLLNLSLEAPIRYVRKGDEPTFRDCMLTESRTYPWSAFFWQSVLGPEGDETEPYAHTLSPSSLVEAWQKATVGETHRHLIEASGTQLLAVRKSDSPSLWTSPIFVFTLVAFVVSVITVGQHLWGWHSAARVTDILLLVCYTLIAIFLTWLVLFSSQDGTRWNWYLLYFNPISLALWFVCPKWQRGVSVMMAIIFLFYFPLSVFFPQIDVPHILFMAPFAIRLIPRLKIETNKNNADE